MSDEQLVNVPQGPLVAPASDVLNTGAVENLVDAFKKGFVTSQDIVDRIGDIGKAKKQSLLQALGEHVSPEAINSRMAAYKAAGAQSELQTAQSQAGLGLVQPQAKLAATQTAAAQAAAEYGATGLQAFNDLYQMYNEHPSDYNLPNGQPDFIARTKRGNEMALDMRLAQNWIEQLTPAKTVNVFNEKTQKEEVHELNKFGTDVTAPNPAFGVKGSDAYWGYVKMLQEYLPAGHPLYSKMIMSKVPGGEALGTPVDAPANPHSLFTATVPAGPPTVYASGVTGNEPAGVTAARGQLAQSGMDPAEVNKLTSQEVMNLVTPAAVPVGVSPNAPVIQPAPSATTAAPVVEPANQGIPVKPSQTVSEAVTSLHTIPAVKKWSEAQDVYYKFADAAKEANEKPSALSDLGLAEAYSKMFDPQSTIREFKWEALTKAIPIGAKIKDLIPILLKEKTFPASVRQQIIDSGMGNIDGADRAARPALAAAEARHPGILDDRQRAVVNGVPARQQFGFGKGAPAAAAPAGGKFVNIPGLGKGMMMPDGTFLPQ